MVRGEPDSQAAGAESRQGRRPLESWMVSDRAQVCRCTTGCLTGVENLVLLPFEPLQALEWKCYEML